ncbi:MAG: 3'(2'),5'-bisphosphate nucleotidase CysQ [Trueperaceae bacterium]|nr:3'(2'),5'-bisphosphate nucleotidase CysQ [Trueperaceae bacterium]
MTSTPLPDPHPLVDPLLALVADAGAAIRAVYDAPGDVETKADGSPLTRADLAAHAVLDAGLRALTPDVPVLSEEGDAADPGDPAAARRRAGWRAAWLVDPLDGTKEFLARNGEFTVNVALADVRDGVAHPTLGVVHVPVTGETYLGVVGDGAWRDADGVRTPVAPSAPRDVARVVASRSHRTPATDAFVQGLGALYPHVETTTSGSALKICRVAEGAAHYYPRVGPTMRWDTAAADAVLRAAGGALWRYGTRTPLTYDLRELVNPPFLAVHGPDARLPDAYDAAADATP